ncbi:MAG: hypothetical protein GY927_18685 [bacterium]|nr:hypothetical protein [bacterium]
MADETIEVNENNRLKARRERMSGGARRRNSPWAIILFLTGIVLLAIFVVFPDETRRLLGLGTSTSEDIQKTSKVDSSGISTEIVREPGIEFVKPKPAPVVIPPAPKKAELDPEAAARIAALEKALKEITDRPIPGTGPSAYDIKKLLDQQSTALRAEAESREQLLQAKLDALRAQQSIPKGLSAEELAKQERLRLTAEGRERRLKLLAERKAKRDAELLKRRVSDGNVYDESEEGKSTSGTKEGDTGVRELSQNEKFLKSAATSGFETSRATDLGDISKVIVQGTIISAVLETAINTELPGNIRAQVVNPVYSFDGQTILMPAGTRLIGTYNSKISIAQKRVLIAWNRAITPEGKSVKLAATGTDRLGRGGQSGNVDTRFFQRFGTAILITSISAIPSFLANNEATGNSTVSAANDVAQDASGDLKDATEDVLEEYLKLPPIIRIPQGTVMNVLVNQDLDFS